MPGLKKIVLCFVAREAKLSTGEAHLTIREVAYRCGISDSSARCFLKELEDDGHIARVHGPSKCQKYRVNLGEAKCSVSNQ